VPGKSTFKIRIETLKKKSGKLLSIYPGYTPEWLALGIEDVKDYMERYFA